jgi:transcriptional regulator with XRE-family HTH domain
MEIGKTIRILRTVRGLRLVELAHAAGISTPFLSLIETGERQPSLDVIRRLAAALRVPSEVLVLLACKTMSLRSADEAVGRLAAALGRINEAEESLRAALDGREQIGPKRVDPG